MIARYMLLLVVPLAIGIKFYLDEQAKPEGLKDLGFTRPHGWSYLTETQVRPDGDRIRYTAAELQDAFARARTTPLFALTRHAAPHAGFNPVIGVNLDYLGVDADTDNVAAVLSRRVEDLQEQAEGAYVIAEPVSTIILDGRTAARVELVAAATTPDAVREKLIVIALLSDRLGVLIAGSGATSGAERIDDIISAFAASMTTSADQKR